ncbi:MAG: phospholipase D family protein [Chloroflexi bacterium]|nr:phospholipase D family protein [Chloroflexota bacterium]
MAAQSPGKAVFLEDDVPHRILSVVNEAQRYVVMVTPYLDLWLHAQVAIERAVKRGVDVTLVLREESHRDQTSLQDISWLLVNGVKILAIKGLHAKIYLSEKVVVVSSMNLHESSAKNSLEIALTIRQNEDQHQIREYVSSSLLKTAKPLEVSAVNNPRMVARGSSVISSTGVCIRCRQTLLLDPSKPLCDPCFESWAEWGNEFYSEVFCHSCGKPSNVSKAKPLCTDCFRHVFH